MFESLEAGRVFAGDMYEYISEIEVNLHQWVQELLRRKFGSDEAGWRRNGVPVPIRVKCASRREEDEIPSDPFAYVDLIDLSKIIISNWNLFKESLPQELKNNRKALDTKMTRLNRIRNAVMHPVKDREWSEDDFEFVRQLRRGLGQLDDFEKDD